MVFYTRVQGGFWVTIREIDRHDKQLINAVVALHILTFKGFFLSSMNRGFLRWLYRSFCEFEDGTLLVAFDEDKPIGFIAYSKNISNLYKYMIKRHLLPFAWYSFLSFLRRPLILPKLFKALTMPSSSKRDEESVKVSSIGVDPEYRRHGVGSRLLDEMKNRVDFTDIDYITLETDRDDNDNANEFYQKNGFKYSYGFVTREGRAMNVYHYRKKAKQ